MMPKTIVSGGFSCDTFRFQVKIDAVACISTKLHRSSPPYKAIIRFGILDVQGHGCSNQKNSNVCTFLSS